MKDYQVMPPLSPDEYQALKDDIAARGVQVPIEFDTDGNVIDGHHRLQICEELGITDYPKIIRAYASEDDKLTQARALNMTRRHLSRNQRRELIKAQIKATPEKSDRQIASELGVTHPTVSAIRHEMESAGDVEKFTTSKDTIGREQPRNRQKRVISVFNPTDKEVEALKDPDIQRRMTENDKLNVSGAIREQTRDNYVAHLESPSTQADKAARGVYDVVVVNPPYDRMSIDEIKSIHIPADKDCHVFLWTDNKHIPEAFDIFISWGVKYVLEFICDKPSGEKIDGTPIDDNGMFIAYGHIGAPQFVDDHQFWTFIDGGVDGFYKTIKRVTAGRRVEIFSDRDDDGFESWKGAEL